MSRLDATHNNRTLEKASCDLLISGGLILTLDGQDRTFARGAIAIKADQILAIGEAEEIEARYCAQEVIQGDDFILMPGFINSHNHTPLMAVRGMIEDLNFAPAYTKSIPNVHSLSFEDTLALSRLGAYELLRAGITTAVDYYRHPLALAQAAEEVGLRAVVCGRIHDADTQILSQGRYEHRTAIGEATLKETLDLIETWQGRANGRIRCDFAPHAADTCSKALLKEIAALAGKYGGNVHTHLAQSRKEVEHVKSRDGVLPHQLFAEVGLLDSRMIAAHCVFLEPQDQVEVGRAGVAIAHAPHQNARVGNIAPILDLERAGARITLCTDTRSADLFEAMRLAVASARIRVKELEPKSRKAISWITGEAAKAIGMADSVGSLAPGKKADLIMLDRHSPNLAPVIDGYGILVHSAQSLNVDTVVVDGRVLLQGGKPVAFDGREIVKAGQSVAQRLWQEQGVRSIA